VGPSQHEGPGQEGIAGDIGAAITFGQLMDAAPVDLDHGQPDETGERFETARNPHGRPHIGPEELVAVEVSVIVPAGAIGAGVTDEGLVAATDSGIECHMQPQFDPEMSGAIVKEREVEAASVPGDQHAGGKLAEDRVEFDQQLSLIAIEHHGEIVATDRGCHHRSDCGI